MTSLHARGCRHNPSTLPPSIHPGNVITQSLESYTERVREKEPKSISWSWFTILPAGHSEWEPQNNHINKAHFFWGSIQKVENHPSLSRTKDLKGKKPRELLEKIIKVPAKNWNTLRNSRIQLKVKEMITREFRKLARVLFSTETYVTILDLSRAFWLPINPFLFFLRRFFNFFLSFFEIIVSS